MIDLVLRKEAPQLVCAFSEQEASGFAQRLLAATKAAVPSDGEVLVLVPAHAYKRAFSVEEACAFGAELCAAIDEHRAMESEARRAAGFSPRGEETEVRHGDDGAIIGMSKRLRY